MIRSLPMYEGRKISMELLQDIALLNEVVLVLRCLSLRETDMMGWLNFTSLQSHLEMRVETELGERAEAVGHAAMLCKENVGTLGWKQGVIRKDYLF